MELRFTDGTTTVRILPSGGEAVLKRWTPQTPEVDTVDVAGALSDGGERPVVAYRNVTEQMDVVWAGAASEQRQRLNTLNRLFEGARHRQRTGVGPRVYVEFRASDAEDWWRSEVLSGRVLVDDGDLDFDLQLVTAGLEGAIIYTRRYYWEGPEEKLPLTNGNGTLVTNGLTVYNHDDADAGDDNWVQIPAKSIAMDLPTPVRLELTNTYESETRVGRVFIGHNAYSSPATLVHMLEAEDAAHGGLGTVTAHATASAGYYTALEWASTSETKLLEWTLTTAQLNALAGNYAHILLRLYNTSIYTNLWLRLRVLFAVSTIWEGPAALMRPNRILQDLGTVQLPPHLVGAGDLYPLSLALYGRRAEAGTHLLNVDFAQVAPADGWRRLEPKGYGLGEDVTLVDDMMEDLLYTEGWATAGAVGNYLAYGPPILLANSTSPQRLYFLWDTTLGGAGIDRTLSVKAFYRPRRLTI